MCIEVTRIYATVPNAEPITSLMVNEIVGPVATQRSYVSMVRKRSALRFRADSLLCTLTFAFLFITVNDSWRRERFGWLRHLSFIRPQSPYGVNSIRTIVLQT